MVPDLMAHLIDLGTCPICVLDDDMETICITGNGVMWNASGRNTVVIAQVLFHEELMYGREIY